MGPMKTYGKLKPDGVDRGPHAIHLYPDVKLTKHRTIIRSFFPVLCILNRLPMVGVVSLGKIVITRGQVTPGVTVMAKDKVVRIVAADEHVMQTICLTPAGSVLTEILATTIREHVERGELKLVS